MVQKSAMKAEIRAKAGKGASRVHRRQNRIPAVIYGDNKSPVMITLDEVALMKELNKSGFFTRIFDIEVEKDKHHVLPRDVQFHPVTDRPEHVDFMRVTDKTEVYVSVTVHALNQEECKGIKRGGVLNLVRHEIEVLCRAANIPSSIDIDIASFEIGDVVHINDIKLPDGVKATGAEENFTVLTIAAPAVEKEPSAEEAAEGEDAEGAAEGEKAEEGEKKED